MNEVIELLYNKRKALLKLTDQLSENELNIIPAGFNNNIIWNMGHVLSVEQSIFYNKRGFLPVLSRSFIANYAPGTRPHADAGQGEITQIRRWLLWSIEQFDRMYTGSSFKSGSAACLPYGTAINADESFMFLLFHEEVHQRVIKRMKLCLPDKNGGEVPALPG